MLTDKLIETLPVSKADWHPPKVTLLESVSQKTGAKPFHFWSESNPNRFRDSSGQSFSAPS